MVTHTGRNKKTRMDINEQYRTIINTFESRKDYSSERYENRNKYETDYFIALEMSKCLLIKGNSGSGKTWLTEYVLNYQNKKVETINLASVLQHGSLYSYFEMLCGPTEQIESTQFSGTGGLPFIKGTVTSEKSFTQRHDYFYEYLKQKRGMIDYIVFDNLECIVDNERIIEELRGIITLSDDKKIRECGIKFIFIGANSGINEFFIKIKNQLTIKNRIYELEEIKGFSLMELQKYLYNSFNNIGIKCDDKHFAETVKKYTSGNPQNVNDLCLQIALIAYRNEIKELNDDLCKKQNIYFDALNKWLKSSFSSEYASISELFNNNQKKDPLLNRILFILQGLENSGDLLDENNLFVEISNYFEDEKLTKKKIRQYLKQISDGSDDCNILQENGKGQYCLRNYKTKICLGAALFLKEKDVCIIKPEESAFNY